QGPTESFPYWFRLTRTGDTIVSYYSDDGSNWTMLATDTILMNNQVYIGLAVLSRDDGVLNTSTFDNVSVSSTMSLKNAAYVNPSERLKSRIRFYPNPVTDKLILTNVPGGSHLSTYSLLGRKVYEQKQVDGGQISIETNSWAPGVYIIRIVNSDSTIDSFKITRQ
uniref:T9SS type A sorting domain-containing protein n=1 Tax=Mariniphaga sediminis TaxID=1628158 RepID=UPI0035636FA7